LISILESLNEVSILILFIVAIILERSLRKKKKRGLLSRSETILYIVTSATTLVYIVSYILLYIGTR
jgi:hypothetical protein